MSIIIIIIIIAGQYHAVHIVNFYYVLYYSVFPFFQLYHLCTLDISLARLIESVV